MQKTIQSVVACQGIGVHTGQSVSVSLKPAAVNTGIRFYRSDCQQTIPVHPLSIQSSKRASILCHQQTEIMTPEHLLATLRAFGITNLVIDIDGPELPILDGSAMPWVSLLHQTNIEEQAVAQPVIKLAQPIRIEDHHAQIVAIPSDQFQLTYLLTYDQTVLGTQAYHATLSQHLFETDIAPARTFGFLSELAPLLKKGLAKGADYANVLVIDDDQPTYRMDQEPARHKVLDMIGDLAILGAFLNAHVIGIRSGHHLNLSLVQQINHFHNVPLY